jgi:hypothetical protein
MDASSEIERLAALSRGFRERYLPYAEIAAQLEAWAEAWPDLVRLRSIGTSHEGRPLWLITIGREPDRRRPSLFVDGNMHATELAGSSVALAIAEDVLRLHLSPGEALHGLPEAMRARLRSILVHVLPRTSPDGAECVLESARYCRSNPRDRRPNRAHARWLAEDVDGDGLALSMRRRDPAGEFVESTEVAGLMLPRTPFDDGPFYKIWPEGTIESFDGSSVPDPHFLSDNDVDLNRNFPWSWAPEPEQIGAGAFPGSEPESRAIVEFVTATPEIFAWVNYHTFGGVFIRPLGHQPDAKMDPFDLAIYHQIGAWAEELTGYPMVSGFEEFLYEPEKPLRGDLSDFGYHQRGALSYVVELWDVFAQLGIARKKPFVDHYVSLEREDLVKLAKWDRSENAGRLIRPWKPVVHPQLGEVEVGGFDPRIGISNPPLEALPKVCAQHAAHTLRVGALSPAITASDVRKQTLEGDVHRLEITVRNEGYLPTHVLGAAKKLPWNEPLYADVTTGPGLSLITPGEAHQEVGHLDGWGRGLKSDESSIFWLRSRGSSSERTLRWTVRGRGIFGIRIGSCRMGTIEVRVEI